MVGVRIMRGRGIEERLTHVSDPDLCFRFDANEARRSGFPGPRGDFEAGRGLDRQLASDHAGEHGPRAKCSMRDVDLRYLLPVVDAENVIVVDGLKRRTELLLKLGNVVEARLHV